LTQKVVGVKVSGEILDLVYSINNMIDQLAIFAAEVTRVAREVGTEGKLGVQAEVENIEGTWQEITSVSRFSKTILTDTLLSVSMSTQWLPT
jgi:osomolarity two-component system sensor histidine kinase NIK1